MQFGIHIRRMSDPLALRSILGFACSQGFVFSLVYVGQNREAFRGVFAFERADLFLMLLCTVLSLGVLRLASPRARDALLTRSLLWCYTGLLVLGSLVPFVVGLNMTSIIVEGVLVGVPAGFIMAAWGRALGARPIERFVPEVFIAAALAALMCLVCSLIASPYVFVLLKLLPFASVFALSGLIPFARKDALRAQKKNPEEPLPFSFGDLIATRKQRDETKRLSKKIIAGCSLFGLTAGFMETFASNPALPSAPSFFAGLLLLVLFCIAALQLISSASMEPRDAEVQGPLDGVYRLAVLVMMAGFLFVPVLSPFKVPGESIMLAGYLGLTYVLISLFLVMAKLTGQDAAIFFARGFSMLYLGEMAGIVLGNAIGLFKTGGQIPYAVAAFAGLAALYAYLFLFTERDFHALSVIMRDADHFGDVCRAITETYALSKRESEILPLALRGRTGERIASELFISKSTVDTHLRRIYAKTGTHGRQELIDLGERTAHHFSCAE